MLVAVSCVLPDTQRDTPTFLSVRENQNQKSARRTSFNRRTSLLTDAIRRSLATMLIADSQPCAGRACVPTILSA